MRRVYSLLISLSFLLALPAFANHDHSSGGGPGGGGLKRLPISLEGSVYRGYGQRIFLKKELKAAYPNLRLKNFKLKRVRLVAKNKRGVATAYLTVDGNTVDYKDFYGDRKAYRNNSPDSYQKQVLENQSGNSSGPWQIMIDSEGPLKVRKAVVVLKRKRGGYPPAIRSIRLGTHKADRFDKDKKSFSLSGEAVKSIKVVGLKGTTRVTKAYAVSQSGRHIDLYQLERDIYSGDVEYAALNGERINKIVIVAMTPYWFGSRGKIEVFAEVFQ